MDIGKQFDKQITIRRIYLEKQAKIYRLQGEIYQADHKTPLRLRKLEALGCLTLGLKGFFICRISMKSM